MDWEPDMFKTLCLIMLMLFCSTAQADWQQIGENSTETAYVDNIVAHGPHKVRMWGLFDLKTPGTFGDLSYSSMKIQREYHCKDRISRVIFMAAYAGQMGEGEMIYSNNNTHSKWMPIQPDSAEEALWNVACKKITDN
jgi:hypothetical protein